MKKSESPPLLSSCAVESSWVPPVVRLCRDAATAAQQLAGVGSKLWVSIWFEKHFFVLLESGVTPLRP